MKKNKNNKKSLIIFILVLIATFILFIYIYNKKRNYKISYVVDSYTVVESFSLEKDHYYLSISKDNKTYELYLPLEYSPKRKIVTKVENVEDTKKSCIMLNEDILSYPICKQNDEYVSYYLETEVETEKHDTYNNIDIYDLENNTYLVWNYRGFYYINKDKITSINLFKKDTYMPYLLYTFGDYLFIVDYDEQYSFDSYYLIDSKKATSKKYKLDKEISLDSYILGKYKNSIYIVDRKAEQEYEINAKKGKIYKTSGKILKNNIWEKIDISQLIKKDYSFEDETKFSFSLENKKLYYIQNEIKTRVTNLDVDYIINYDEENVYFVSNGTVYKFNLKQGIKKILQYSEWNFNYENCVFVFENQK